MRKIECSKQFNKSWQSFKKSGQKNIQKAKTNLKEILDYLQNGEGLPDKYYDHTLKGDKKNYRDCHVLPDLVLIYSIKEDEDGTETIYLAKIGTHSDLYG